MPHRSALQIPRAPVLGWRTFVSRTHGNDPKRAAPTLRSVADGRAVLYTTSGQAAIALALATLDVRPGEGVLVPTYHCMTMIDPVVRRGARPMFFPVTPEGLPDLEWLARHASAGTRVLIAAHYFGFGRSMAELQRFCKGRGIAFIEDCAHAFFGMAGVRPVGAWGDFAIASLTKFFPVSEGGCLVLGGTGLEPPRLARASLSAELRALWDCIETGSRYGRLSGLNGVARWVRALERAVKSRRVVAVPGGAPGAEGIPRSAGDVTAGADPRVHPAAGIRAATRVTRWIARHAGRARIVANRRSNYALYGELLADLPGCRPLYPLLPPHTVPYVFPLHVDDADGLYAALRQASAPVARWDYRWPGTPSLPGDCGHAWSRTILQLGCHQDMREDDVRAVAAIVRRHVHRQVEGR